MNRPGLTVDGNGSILRCNKSISNFQIVAPRFTLKNFEVIEAGLLMEAEADSATLMNCVVGKRGSGTVGQAFKTMKGGTGGSILGCQIGLTRTVSAFFDENSATVSGCDFDGVINGVEYAIRGSVSDDNRIPTGFLLENSNVRNPNSTKDTCGWRSFHGVVINGCKIVGNFRFGQEPKFPPYPTPGLWVDAIIHNTTFTSNNSPRSALMVDQGSSVSATDLTFIAFKLACMGASVNSTLETTRCMIVVPAGGITPKFISDAGRSRWKDNGGNKVMVGGAVIVQPVSPPVSPGTTPTVKPPVVTPIVSPGTTPTVKPPVVKPVVTPVVNPVVTPVVKPVVTPVVTPTTPTKITSDNRVTGSSISSGGIVAPGTTETVPEDDQKKTT